MTIPFEKVYRMKGEEADYWTIVMGLTPTPGTEGLWMWRASLTHPETIIPGKVFEGEEGKIVVIGRQGRFIFEPLTVDSWEDMKSDVSGFDAFNRTFTTDDFLQSWYWSEFAHDGSGNEIPQGEIIKRLATRITS